MVWCGVVGWNRKKMIEGKMRGEKNEGKKRRGRMKFQ